MTRKLKAIIPLAILLALTFVYVGCSDDDDNGTDPPTTGTIQVNSTPNGATISLNDSNTQRTTPATLTNIAPGTYSVSLNLTGYEEFTASVTVTAGQTSTVNATLVQSDPTGTLVVNSDPNGAQIWIEGVNTGETTDHTFNDYDVGEYDITLRLTGYADYEETVNVTENQTTTVNATLTAATYTVSLTPAGEGTVTISPDKAEYDAGEEIEISATAETGWAFHAWDGDYTSTKNPDTLTVNSDLEIDGVFSAPFAVSGTITLNGGGTLQHPIAFLDTSQTDEIVILRDTAFIADANGDFSEIGFWVTAKDTFNAIVTGWDNVNNDGVLGSDEPQGWWDTNGDDAWDAQDGIEVTAGTVIEDADVQIYPPSSSVARKHFQGPQPVEFVRPESR